MQIREQHQHKFEFYYKPCSGISQESCMHTKPPCIHGFMRQLILNDNRCDMNKLYDYYSLIKYQKYTQIFLVFENILRVLNG